MSGRFSTGTSPTVLLPPMMRIGMQVADPAPDHNVPRVIETGVRIWGGGGGGGGGGYEYHTNAASVCGTCHMWVTWGRIVGAL